jgi:hypothetical protein
MKRIRLEVVYHVADSDDEHLIADRLDEHMRKFLCFGRSANAAKPHYESCEVSVERKTWEKVT